MNALDKAYETQLKNIQTKTGKTLDEMSALMQNSGLSKHGEIRDLFKRDLGLGHGDANALAHFVLKSAGPWTAEASAATPNSVLDEIYSGAKAALRPIHDKLMAAIDDFGDFEIASKKGYVSLRRKKQFAMIGPATAGRVEVGINMKGVTASERLVEQPTGSMCNYKVKVTAADEVDDQLLGWIKQAFEGAA